MIDEHFQEFAQEHGFTWIPVLQTLALEYTNSDTDLYYRLDGHLNKNGNKIIGDQFAAEFLEIFRNQLPVNKN